MNAHQRRVTWRRTKDLYRREAMWKFWSDSAPVKVLVVGNETSPRGYPNGMVLVNVPDKGVYRANPKSLRMLKESV